MNTVPFERRRSLPSLDKPLPHSLEAERAVLGAILLADSPAPNSALRQAGEYVNADDFFLKEHKVLFASMRDLDGAGKPIDPVTLFDILQSKGQLEASGGPGYLSQLPQGLPRVSNVSHYARIVLEQSLRRRIVYGLVPLIEDCYEPSADPKEIENRYQQLMRGIWAQRGARLATVDSQSFLTMALPEMEYVIQPLLSVRGRGMIYSPRGGGKTYITLEMAYCIAAGITEAFVWRVPKARPVLYVDGEMHVAQLQQRVRHIFQIHGGVPPEENYFRFVTRDLQKDARPKINTSEGRAQIEGHLESGAVLILDNLSALAPSSDEAETDEWAKIEDWLIDLSWRGISTIFVHHAGKSGEQRGTSKREDLLDFVLRLKTPLEYHVDEGLRAEAYLTKVRGKVPEPKWGWPFEIVLRDNEWATRPLRDILRQRAKEMLEAGMKPNDVALETGLSRFVIYRLQRSLKDGQTEIQL